MERRANLTTILLLLAYRAIVVVGLNSSVDLGMESRDIMDAQLTASSVYDAAGAHYPPWAARRNNDNVVVEEQPAWRPSAVGGTEWIQVDLLVPHHIEALVLQGDMATGAYVTSYTVEYTTQDILLWETYAENGVTELQSNLSDGVTPVLRSFDPAIQTSRLRIAPKTYSNQILLRFEVQGYPLPCPAVPSTGALVNRGSSPCACASGAPSGTAALCLEGGDWVEIDLGYLHHLTGIELTHSDIGSSTTLDLGVMFRDATGTMVDVFSAGFNKPLTLTQDRINSSVSFGRVVHSSFIKVRVDGVPGVTDQCAQVYVQGCKAAACPPDHVESGESCYRQVDHALAISDPGSKMTCGRTHWMSVGALVSVASVEEQGLVKSLSLRMSAAPWLGLFVVSDEKDANVNTPIPTKTWRWMDGEPSMFRVWDGDGITGEPQELAGENCAAMLDSPYWHSVDCTSRKPSLCETKASVSQAEVQWTMKKDFTLSQAASHEASGLTLTQCLYTCQQTAQFQCASVAYKSSSRACRLHDVTHRSGGVSLVATASWDYWQKDPVPESLGCNQPLIWEADGSALKRGVQVWSSGFLAGRDPSVSTWLYGELSSWRPSVNSQSQWLKVDLVQTSVMHRLVVRGGVRNDNCFMTKFVLAYSNYTSLYYYRDPSGSTTQSVFSSWDNYSPSQVIFQPPLVGRFLHLWADAWISSICMRIEVFGCPLVKYGPSNACMTRLHASGYSDSTNVALIERNHVEEARVATSYGFWLAAMNTSSEPCSLLEPVRQFDTYTVVVAAQNMVDWITGLANGTLVVGVSRYRAEARLAPAVQPLKDLLNVDVSPLVAYGKMAWQAVKGKPYTARTEWDGRYGSPVYLWERVGGSGQGCYERLGMVSKAISLSQIHVQGEYNPYYGLQQVRLLSPARNSGINTGWVTDSASLATAWVSVDLYIGHRITGLETRGCDPTAEYSKTVSLSSSQDGETWTAHTDSQGNNKVYEANWSPSQLSAFHIFPPIESRHLKIHILSYLTKPCIQFEIIGCPLDLSEVRAEETSSWSMSASSTYDDQSGAAVTASSLSDVCQEDAASCVHWCSDDQGWTLNMTRMFILTSVTVHFAAPQNLTEIQPPPVTLMHRTEGLPWRETTQDTVVSWNRSAHVVSSVQHSFSPMAKAQYVWFHLEPGSVWDSQCFHLVLHGKEAAACPPGSVQYLASCYTIPTLSRVRSQQQEILCDTFTWTHPGHQVRIDSSEEATFAASLFTATDSSYTYGWVDGKKVGSDWVYSDGSPMTLAPHWRPAEPASTDTRIKTDELAWNYGATQSALHAGVCETPASVPPGSLGLPVWTFRPDHVMSAELVFRQTQVNFMYAQECMSLCQQENEQSPDHCRSVTFSRAAGECSLNAASSVANYSSLVPQTGYYQYDLTYTTECNDRLLQNMLDENNVTLSVSSQYNVDAGADQAPLHIVYGSSKGCWYAVSTEQWIKAEFIPLVEIAGVITRGGGHYSGSWVKTYTLFFLNDVGLWQGVKSQDGTTEFLGNFDRNRLHTNYLDPTIKTRAILLHPTSVMSLLTMTGPDPGGGQGGQRPPHPAIEVTHFSVAESSPYSTLGTENGDIGLSQMQGNTRWTGGDTIQYYYSADGARLNFPEDGSTGFQLPGWRAKSNALTHWLQIDLILAHTVAGVVTQASYQQPRNLKAYVTAYTVLYSTDEAIWTSVKDASDNEMIFPGNFGLSPSLLTQYFLTSVTARYVRINPREWYNYAALRMDLIGKPQACGALEASMFGSTHAPQAPTVSTTEPGFSPEGAFPRLYQAGGPWCSAAGDTDPSAAVDLGVLHLVTGLRFVGTTVSAFHLNFTNDGVDWKSYMSPASQSTLLTLAEGGESNYTFPRLLKARGLKVIPTVWTTPSACFSVDIHACRADACPPSFVQHGSKCYFHTNGSATGDQAKAICSRGDWMGPGRQLTPKNYNELAFAQIFIDGYGLANLVELSVQKSGGGEWQWPDGSPADPLPWSTASEPGATDQCARLSETCMCLVGISCSLNHIVACETDASVFPSEVLLEWNFLEGLHLDGVTVMRELQPVNVSACMSYCQQDPLCLSINFDRTIMNCQLNNATYNTAGASLVAVTKSKYIEKSLTDASCDTPLLASVDDSQLTALSEAPGYPATAARLFVNYSDGTPTTSTYWKAADITMPTWIQVNLGSTHSVRRITVQGSFSLSSAYLSEVYVLYSTGASYYKVYDQPGGVFRNVGTFNDRLRMTYVFNPVFEASMVKLFITDYSGAPAAHWELNGCPVNVTQPAGCSTAIGLENGRVLPTQLKASSSHWDNLAGLQYLPSSSRLNGANAWLPFVGTPPGSPSWLQVNLLVPHSINAVITQGFGGAADDYLKTFRIQHSLDGQTWQAIMDTDTERIYSASVDSTVAMAHDLVPPIVAAQYVRIFPETWQNEPALRWELLGCPADCPALAYDKVASLAVSTTDGSCTQTSLFPSSNASCLHWCAASSDTSPWLQVEFPRLYHVTGYEIRNQMDKANTTASHLNYSSDGVIWRAWDSALTSQLQQLDGVVVVTRVSLHHVVTALAIQLYLTADTSVNPDICISLQVNACQATACPTGFARFGGDCYYVDYTLSNYATAEARCEELGWMEQGHIADVKSAEENDFVYSLIRSKTLVDAYVGLNYNTTDNTFKTHPDNLSAEYFNWGPGCPVASPASEPCTAVSADAGMWCGQMCTAELGYICKTKASVGTVVRNWAVQLDTNTTDLSAYSFLKDLNETECLQSCEELSGCASVLHVDNIQGCWWSSKNRYVGAVKLVNAVGVNYWESFTPDACSIALVASGLYQTTITSSSVKGIDTGVEHVVLGHHAYVTGNQGYWAPADTDSNRWIKVLFDRLFTVTMVATQGSNTNYNGQSHSDKFVRSFELKYTSNNVLWKSLINPHSGSQVFEGNKDYTSLSYHQLPSLPSGIGFQFDIMSWDASPSLKVELYGCPFLGVVDCYQSPAPIVNIPGLGQVALQCLEESTPLLVMDTGSVDFDRLWGDYKTGFGSLTTDFWLGNSILYFLTSSQSYRLRVDMWSPSGEFRYSEFAIFAVNDESEGYALQVDGVVESQGGDGGLQTGSHQGGQFYTRDVDTNSSCAATYGSGWWYNSDPGSDCFESKLTASGLNHTGPDASHGIHWKTIDDWNKQFSLPLKKARMRMRPRLDLSSVNVAFRKPAYQASQSGAAGAQLAVDGNLDSDLIQGQSCSSTQAGSGLWWYVDLLRQYAVTSVTLANRADCCESYLNDFDVLVGSNVPVSGSTAGFQLCFNHPAYVGGGAVVSLVCDLPIKGQYVLISKRSTEALTLCEVEVYTEYESKEMYEPCSMNEDCVSLNSECTPIHPNSYDYDFICQCAFNHQDRNSECVPAADVSLVINQLDPSGVEIVRAVESMVKANITLSNIAGESIPRGNYSNSALNFNITGFLSSGIPCGGNESSYCNLDIATIDTGHADLQMSLNVSENATLSINVTANISTEICHQVTTLCIQMTADDNAPYVELNAANNMHCVNVLDIVICQPPVDLRVSGTEFIGSTPITRGLQLAYPFRITLSHQAGAYDIVPLHQADNRNYKYQYFVSDRDVTNGTETGLVVVEVDLDLAEAQRGLARGASVDLVVPATILLDRDQCAMMTHLCVLIIDHPTASFWEANQEDNINCSLVEYTKVCDPEIELIVTSMNLKLPDIFVRGYNFSYQLSVALLNTNDTISIAEVSDPDANFACGVYLSSHDLEITNKSLATTVVEVNSSVAVGFLQQSITPSGAGNITFDDGIVLISRSSCEQLHYVCTEVLPGTGASYRQPTGSLRHIKCLDLDALKNCRGLATQDVSITPSSSIVEIGTIVQFHINWTIGTDVNFLLKYGDSSADVGWNWEESGHTTSFLGQRLVYEHSFLSHNNYTAELTIWNEAGNDTYSAVIEVQPPLVGYIAIGMDYTPDATPLAVRFYFEPVDANNMVAIVFWCDLDSGENTSSLIFQEVGNQSEFATYTYTSDAPNAFVRLYCFNHVSNTVFDAEVILRQHIEDLYIVATHPAFATNASATFDIGMTNGSHVHYDVDYGDGTMVSYTDSERLSYASNFSVSHMYSQAGNYTVNITAYNEHYQARADLTGSVIIQNPVHSLSLGGPDVVAVPPGSARFSLFSADNGFPPSEAFCTWAFNGITKRYVYSVDLMQSESSMQDFIYGRERVGSAMVLNVTCSNLVSVAHVQKEVQVQEVVTAMCVAVWPQFVTVGEQTNVTTTLANGSDVQFQVTFGDGDSTNVLHPDVFASESALQVGHNYAAIGNYTIEVSAWNSVSHTDSTEDHVVVVQHKITNLTIDGSAAILWPPGDVVLTIKPGDGQLLLTDVHCSWNMGDGVVHQTYVASLDEVQGQETTYTYSVNGVGLRNVSANCSNLISGQQLYIEVDVILDETILASLSASGPVLWSNVSHLTVQVQRFSSESCFQWDMGDGAGRIMHGVAACGTYAVSHSLTFYVLDPGPLPVAHAIPVTFELNYTYGDIGTYNVSLTAFNDNAEQELSTYAHVLDWPCEKPALTLPNNASDSSQPLSYMRSERFSIVPSVQLNCSKTDLADYSWSVFKLGHEHESPVMSLSGLTFIHSPRILSYGLFVARLTVAMSIDHPVLSVDGMVSTVDAHLEITPTPLEVSIVNGEEHGTVFNRTQLINAIDVTFDHDVRSSDKTGMTFKWYCRRRDDESFPMAGDKLYDQLPTPAPDQDPDPLIGYGGCFGDGPGLLPHTTGKFEINTSTMMTLSHYIFRVEVQKDARYGFFEQDLFVALSDTPVVNVSCRENCGERSRVSGRIILSASCTAHCVSSFGVVSYIWRIFEQLSNGSYTEVNMSSIAVTGVNDRSLFIKAWGLQGGAWYKAVMYARTPVSPNATAVLHFEVNLPPYGGTCEVMPSTGMSGDTLFSIECMEWKEWKVAALNGLKYEYRVKQKGAKRSLLFYFGNAALSDPVVFPVGNIEQDFLNEVILLIYDRFGDYWTLTMEVTVFPPGGPKLQVANDIKDLASGKNPKLKQQLESGDYLAAVSGTFAAASILNVPPDWSPSNNDSSTAEPVDMVALMKMRAESRTLFIAASTKLPAESPDTLDQNNELMYSLLKQADEVNIEGQETATSRMSNLTQNYIKLKANMTAEKTESMAGDLVENSLRLMVAGDNYLNTVPLYDLPDNASSDPGALPTTPAASLTTPPALTNGTRAGTQDNPKRGRVDSVMAGSLANLDMIGSSLQSNMEANDPSYKYEYEELSLLVGVETAERLNNSEFRTKQGAITVEKLNMLDDNGTTDGCFRRQMLFSQFNPFIGDDSADQVNSPVVDFTLPPCSEPPSDPANSRKRRRKRSVPDGAESSSFVVELQLQSAEPIYVNGTATDAYGMLYHVLNVTEPLTPFLITVYPSANETLAVYVRLGENPTPSQHEWHIHVGNFSASDNESDASNASLYTLFIPADELKNATLLNQSLHIGVRHAGCQVDKSCPSYPEAGPVDLEYSIIMVNSGCQTWSDVMNQWVNDNCEVEKGTTPEKVKFKSNLFGGFGAGLFTPPNTIDFGSVFDNFADKLIENMPVVGTVIGVFLLFIPLCILCRLFDKRDAQKWLLLPLVDNYNEDKYRYELHVYTGLKAKSETTSNISFVLGGSEGDTGTRKLDDGVRKNFHRGEVNSFLMKTHDTIGSPMTLHIWHDNTGKGANAGWFLSKIIVADVQARKWYLFMCDKWLDVNEEDGRIERILHMSTTSEAADSGALLQNNVNRKLFDDHIWLSVGYRKTKTSFSRVQRLTCCLAILYLAMVTNAMWFGTESEGAPQEAITLGPISFTVHEIYTSVMSSLVLFPLVLIITTLFVKSAPKPKKVLTELDSIFTTSKRPKGKLPYWCQYIAWVLTVLAVVTAAFFTILYSFEFGGEKSRAWLATFFLCFLESVLILQPLKAIVVGLLVTFIFKSDSDISEYESSLGKMSTEIGDKSASYVGPSLINSIGQDEIQEMRRRKDRDQKMRTMIKEILYYVIFLMLLLFVIYGNQDSNVFLQNNQISKTFLYKINKINSNPKIWQWMWRTVLPGLYYIKEYNNASTTKYDEKFLSDRYSMRLGPPRLRQLRVGPGYCAVATGAAKTMGFRCTEWYSHDTEDTVSYASRWDQALNISETSLESLDATAAAFVHRTSEELRGQRYWGGIGWYDGGGYIANLGSTFGEAERTVQSLEESNWLDEYTRAVFLEFNVWNANTNLFNLAIVVLELEPVGGAFNWHTVDSVQLYRYGGTVGVVNLLVEIGCIIFVLVIAILEVRKMVKQKSNYFSSAWNVIQMAALGCFAVAFAMYVMRSLWTMWTVEDMMNNKGKTVNFQTLATYNAMFMLFFGLVAFLMQMQLLHMLRYSGTIAILSATLGRSALDLLSFSLVGFLIFVAFASGAYLNFSQLAEYATFEKTATSLTSAFLGKFDFVSLMSWYGLYGGAYLLCYLLTMMFLIVNVFIVMLNEFLSTVRRDKSVQPKDHEVLDHLMHTLRALLPGSSPKMAEPTRAEHTTQKGNSKGHALDDLSERVDILESVTEAYDTTPMMDTMDSLMLYLRRRLARVQHPSAAQSPTTQAPISKEGTTWTDVDMDLILQYMKQETDKAMLKDPVMRKLESEEELSKH